MDTFDLSRVAEEVCSDGGDFHVVSDQALTEHAGVGEAEAGDDSTDEVSLHEAAATLENSIITARVARAGARKSARAAAEKRREVKAKAVCAEDNRGKKEAKVNSTIGKYFLSSRNSRNAQPLFLVCDSMPAHSDPKSSSEESTEQGFATSNVSIDTDVNAVMHDSQRSGTVKGSSSSASDVGVGSPQLEAENVKNAVRADMIQISDGEELDSDDDVAEIPPPPKKVRPNYDRARRFQDEWAAKLVWAESIRGADGHVHLVKCTVCSTFEKKPKILGPKWDTLTKHEGRRKAAFDMPKHGVKKGDWYISKTSRHQINLCLFVARQPATVLEQVNNKSLQKSKKTVQLATVFQILSAGRSMTEYKEREALYSFLNVPNLPKMHWSDSSGWSMAEYMYAQVTAAIQRKVNGSSFLSLSCDEVTTVDNGSWICVHAYIVEAYSRIPLMISLQRVVDGAGADNLTQVIVAALSQAGDLDSDAISKRLLSFGADGVSTFQGARTGVTKQIQQKHAPFALGVHCMAHRCNLAFKALSSLGVFNSIEHLLVVTHAYFKHSPKRHLEFQKLAEVMEMKGLKLLSTVKTRWVSLLEPLRRLLAEYRVVVAKMVADREDNDSAERCLDLLKDPYCLLGMTALLPLMETIDILVTFAQKRDVYICDFVAALKVCEGQLFSLYVDKGSRYAGDEFWAFKNLLDCSHEQIHLKWIMDLNNESAQLAFIVKGEQIWAKRKGHIVDRDTFANVVNIVKDECTGAAQQLLTELSQRFPNHVVMDATGIVYPQYWLQGDCEETFRKHLKIICDFYGDPKAVVINGLKRLVPPTLDRYNLETQQSMFKLAMLNNARKYMEPPFELNPLTRMWRDLDACTVLRVKAFPEYFRLAEVAIVQVLGSVEDERCFSSLAFLKSKLRNSLDTHLQLVVGMYSQKIFSLENFPYDEAYERWIDGVDRRYGLCA